MDYECDIEMRSLEKMIKDFTYRQGLNLPRVLDSLLDYIIGFLDAEGKPLDWHYTKEQTQGFSEMTREYFSILEKVLKHKSWYDAWGDLFMSLYSNGGGKGQFFTPDDMCGLMTQMSIREEPIARQDTRFGKRVTVSDPTAGSSRNLLAVHAKFLKEKWRKPYLSAEDVDVMCCKMSAINLCVHGCFGEVVCHNTLTEPDKVNVGYIINETLLTRNLPSIRRTDNPEEFICVRNQNLTNQIQESNKSNKPRQLTIW